MMRFYGGYGYPMMGAGPGGIIMAIVGILLIVLLIFVIVRMVRNRHFHFEHKQDSTLQESSALKILNERYAKGEINDEEYKAKKANLQ
ncbi:MAG: SHOCT domain-containing protein [Eubacteriales bacterium]